MDSSIFEFLACPLVKIGMSAQNQKHNGKQHRSGRDGSLRVISSGSTLFAKDMFCSAGMKGFYHLRLVHSLWLQRLVVTHADVGGLERL